MTDLRNLTAAEIDVLARLDITPEDLTGEHTMTERIDHAAEARDSISLAQDDALAEEATSITHAMIANAEATLALVEQQRIANLIALSQALDGNGWQAAEPLDAIFAYRNTEPDDEFAGLHIRPDIAAALGIEEVQS